MNDAKSNANVKHEAINSSILEVPWINNRLVARILQFCGRLDLSAYGVPRLKQGNETEEQTYNVGKVDANVPPQPHLHAGNTSSMGPMRRCA